MGGGRAFCLLLPLPGDIRQLVVVVHRAVLLTRSDITVPHAVYGGDYDSHSRSVIYTTALGIIHGGRRRGGAFLKPNWGKNGRKRWELFKTLVIGVVLAS